MTVPGIISGSSEVTSSPCERKIIVANTLPLQSKRDVEAGKWSFSWTKTLSNSQMFLYVGSLNADVEPNEQEEISQKLLVDFNCAATGEETRNYAKLGEEEQVTVLLVASYR
ncbi:hypothetical protein YC2023_018550 [Brassica napus]